MHPTLQLALRAARSVSEHYEYVLERLDLARTDNTLDELLQTCGKRVEQAIERQLVRAHPDASFKGSRVKLEGSGELCWEVNPLVGEENLRRGYPAFALSIAIFQRGRLEQVVLVNPATEQEYLASRGRGATLNGRRIRVLQGWKGEQAAVALPLPGQQREQQLPDYLRLVQQLNAKQIYSSGCNALDICAVAAGQLDAGLFLGANEQELAPALLILKEAGGLSGDMTGAPRLGEQGRLLVTNPKAFRQLVSHLKPCLA